MRPTSFVPMIHQITPQEAAEIPGLGAALSYWTEGGAGPREWFEEVLDAWGPAGFAVRRGEEVQGFVVYGPREHLPRSGRYPLPVEDGAVLLAYAAGDQRTRRRLILRTLRDLRQRGVGRVEAIASDAGARFHVPTRLLAESGWRPVRRCWCLGGFYTLVRVDLGTTVEVAGLARDLLGRVRLPALKGPSPVPGVFSRAAGSRS
ncbi:hypothetical protein Rxyl_0779 [Rubrobacter xylanophilus DSM 9941]|uniref:N-acetyltransferase domain-containing protein n=1 Tax=Rubrobacter xylanophilus (strain DSM 9941 / JCM 11954 / NBRC 16129 / PRD-1) TaxID=266117 RepID=Q1AXY1_RUBXD|nr:hypothetical protein [Rubrobacter xylanophilus]ABG03747.1 hypothetical protein Rxyl_0779 [Rubrobacter xylanophilus DSM 9941]